MLYVIPGSHNCGIKDDLTIWQDGKCIHRRPNKSFEIELFGTKSTRFPQWLLCFSQIRHVDEFDAEHLHFVRIQNSHSKFPWFSWYDTPKIVFENYRVVPSYPELAADKNGSVINSKTGSPVNAIYAYRDGHAYIQRRMDKTGRFYLVGVHRLVALAWIKNDDPVHKVVVNHIDGHGNPLNNAAANLEWTTYKENSDHAKNTGLLTYANVCRIRSAKTGEIKIFPSMHDMANFLQSVEYKRDIYFNVRRCNKLVNGEWEIRLDGDTRPWLFEQNCVNVEPSRYIFKITEPGKEPKIINGTRTVIKLYKLWNLPSASCKEVLKRMSINYPEIQVEVIDQYNTNPIEVKDLRTGRITTYDSNKALHLANPTWRKSTVIDAINYAGTRVLYDHYVLRRKTDQPWPKNIRLRENKAIGLELIDKTTQKVISCSSLRDASRIIGRDRDLIKRMLDSPEDSDRYIVKRSPTTEQSMVGQKVNC